MQQSDMALFLFVFAFTLASVNVEAAITPDSIKEFNLGQLFAFYNTAGLCATDYQFAMAKRTGSGECQWTVAKTFARTAISKYSDLPVKSFNNDCYFSCVKSTGSNTRHAEKVINRRLRNDGINRGNFDLYTYQSPCVKCINGSSLPGGAIETIDVAQWSGVYYTYRAKGYVDHPAVHQVKNKKLLDFNKKHGMQSLKVTTKVNMNDVKTKVEDGRKEKKSDSQIIAGIVGDEFLKNAVKSYLDQHPTPIEKP